MPERIDHVEIPLSRATIRLPRVARDVVLEQLRHLDSMGAVTAAFKTVGTSRSVKLTREQKGDLLRVNEFLGNPERGGLPGLPGRVFELRSALHDDLHDTRKRVV